VPITTNVVSANPVLDTSFCDQVCQWLATGRWFFPVSSTNKTDRNDISEILLLVALNTKTLTHNPPLTSVIYVFFTYTTFPMGIKMCVKDWKWIRCYGVEWHFQHYFSYILIPPFTIYKTGAGRTRRPPPPPPPKLGKIYDFFGVKSWFFTRNTPTFFSPPAARRNFFECAPPNFKSWIRPCKTHYVRKKY
jgi:hypothetical protein